MEVGVPSGGDDRGDGVGGMVRWGEEESGKEEVGEEEEMVEEDEDQEVSLQTSSKPLPQLLTTPYPTRK